ncbi:MAG: inorganic phosphate transporter [Candidatus Peregrinibacteria bacterium]|nr:inorganic phosphate transporter [Candidatus Peregrinibacteria bacterium]
MFQEVLLLIAGIYLAWSLGANDAGNIISTAVGSKSISFKKAMVFFVFCLAFGTIFLSKNVIKTVSSGIVDAEVITINHAIIALFVAASWVHFATWKKWPVSISQSVVSSVLGIGIVESLSSTHQLVHWQTVLTLAGVWLFSPILGFIAAWLIFKVVHGFVRHRHLYFKDSLRDLFDHPIQTISEYFSGDLRRREKIFKVFMLLSSGYMAIALGASTIASTTALVYSGFDGRDSVLGVPLNATDTLLLMKLIVLVSVILGILTYGEKLIDFLGNRLVKLNALRGATVQASAATVIVISALMGYPVSSTGVFVGSFLGMDSGEDHPHMKSHAASSLKMAFLVTIPVTAVLSGVLTWLIL